MVFPLKGSGSPALSANQNSVISVILLNEIYLRGFFSGFSGFPPRFSKFLISEPLLYIEIKKNFSKSLHIYYLDNKVNYVWHGPDISIYSVGDVQKKIKAGPGNKHEHTFKEKGCLAYEPSNLIYDYVTWMMMIWVWHPKL